MLATRTIETFATAILLELGLGRRDILQTIAAEMRIHLIYTYELQRTINLQK